MSSSSTLGSLKEEINAQKTIISNISTQDYYSEEGKTKAGHIRLLSKNEEEYELILESQRVDAVMREHDELHPPTTEDCPICLDTIRMTHPGCVATLFCCGNFVCMKCFRENGERDDELVNCPLCRAPIPSDMKTQRKRIQKHAKAGKVRAQIALGSSYATGTIGFPVNKREAFRLLKLAEEHGTEDPFMYMDALFQLGSFYMNGIEGILQPCSSTAMRYMIDASNRGHMHAQYALGQMYVDLDGKENMETATLYFTLAFRGGYHNASHMLGEFFRLGLGGLNKSLYRAKHYYLEAANNKISCSYHNLSQVLLGLCASQYGGICDIQPERDSPRRGSSVYMALDTKVIGVSGHSCIPNVLFWLRKSVAENPDFRADSAKMIAILENAGKQVCAHCRKTAECFQEPLKACVRCRAAWYCGREVSAWPYYLRVTNLL